MASWFLVRIVLFKAFLKGVVTMSCGNPLWTERTSSVYPMEILEEYIEILQRLTDNETAEYVVKTILNSPFVELITPFYHFNLITVDPDDNKFVDCAISANAHYIVTNDHHYDVLKDIDFPKVNVVNIQQFCIYLSQEK